MSFFISKVKAYEILDSRGNPTVEVKIFDDKGNVGEASVPSGASTGKYEALELRDGDENRFFGNGVLKACENITNIIEPCILNCIVDSTLLERKILSLDKSENKSELGANAILAVSLALRRLEAKEQNKELFELFNGEKIIPVPMMNILNGGVHASNNLDIQEFMILPVGFDSFSLALRGCSEVYQKLKEILKELGLNTNVGDEGGFAPSLENDDEALDLIVKAIEKSGYIPGKHFLISLDVAASEWKGKSVREYYLPKRKIKMNNNELVNYYERLISDYPIYSIEDGLDEEDYSGWKEMTNRINQISLVGDDLFVTNKKRLEYGIANKIANSILIKYNQIGSLSETLDTINLAKKSSYSFIISHRSGETGDTFISDLAVGCGAKLIKAGAPARYERVAKYNRLLEIETDYDLPYAGRIICK